MNPNRKKPEKEHLVNRDIPFKQFFVVDENGQQLGVLTKQQALNLSSEKKLDLVIISTNPHQPVAKILDYGRFKYNRKKKMKEAKIKQTIIENREVRLTAMIGDHDLKTKARKAREFLSDGNRVKVSLKLRGREIARQDLGHEKLAEFFNLLSDIATIQKSPTLNSGRFLDMYLVATKNNKGKKEENNNAKTENETKKSFIKTN